MLKHHREILDVLLDTIKTKYSNDISIMIIYGSCVNGTAHENSDLDIIFIPKTENGWKLSKTFILDGIGYDIWGTTWNQLEKFANFEDMKVSVIAESQLVYYASYEDKQKYENLKNQIKSITDGILTHDLLEKAKTHLNKAKQYYGELCFEVNLVSAGGILMEICDTICLLNHTYLHFGGKRIIEELSDYEKLPEGFVETYNAVIEQVKAIKENCAILIKSTERLLLDLENKTLLPPPDFSGLYEEISSHWNKIRLACSNGDAKGAFISATSLQYELDCVQNQLRTDIDDLRFFEKFDSKNLDKFLLEADRAELAYVSLLQRKGIPIIKYTNIEQLKQSFE